VLIFGLALLYGLVIALVLRGPYWLYKRRKGKPRPFWWPWGIALTLGASVVVFGLFYVSIMETT
jgi:drug/metabolite transporter (DMT)-like permease